LHRKVKKGIFCMNKYFIQFFLTIFFVLSITAIAIASFQEGYDLYRQGKYYDAEKVLLREKELTPKNLDVYAVLGWCYLYTSRYKMAIDISNEGLKINAGDTRMFNTLGRSYMALKRYKEALRYFGEAVALNPNNPYYYYYMGKIFLDQNKLYKAETAFSASIMLQGNRYIFYQYRGEVYERLNKYKLAESDYKKALTLKPNDPRIKDSLIRVIGKETNQESNFE